MRRKRGSLFVVSAPSGAGKTTLCQKLCEILPGISHSVSYTTRSPRPGEIDGVHYTFVDQGEFRSMVAGGEFLEWAEVHGNLYGTSRGRVEASLMEGADIILDVDVQGARQIKEKLPDSILLFILPPSMEVLQERLTGRQSDSEEVIRRRIMRAKEEISEYKRYDYVIVNDLFDDALRELFAIVTAERARIGTIDHEWIEDIFLKEGQNGYCGTSH
ncbi:MAG: guanylate kinase [Nitrospirales bacterium]|nr:guanylate kinase [Nitrospirales bacterium]